MTRKRLLHFSCIGIFLLASAGLKAQGFDVMFYNVHNLFDAEHDEGKNDWEFLPHNYPGKRQNCQSMSNSRYKKSCLNTDWTDQKVELKIEQIAKSIQSKRRRVPDLLALAEVENESVVRRLAQRLGYDQIWITNSPDKRGIEVALLAKSKSSLEYVANQEWVVNSKGGYKPTRNILQVDFLTNGKQNLSVFVNHWPSQGSPSSFRMAAAETLRNAINKSLKDRDDNHIIAVGDFNTLPEEHPHPIRDGLKASNKAETLIDVHDAYMSARSISYEQKRAMPIGTYFYHPKMQWNVLDRILISPNLADFQDIFLDLQDYRIHSTALNRHDYEYTYEDNYNYGSIVKNVPWPTNTNTTSYNDAGYSDHFAVVARFGTR